MRAQELQKDRAAFFRFVEQMQNCADAQGAVQIIPYGEALIHEYYWEGMAALSQNPGLDAVGAQSNFSFPAEKMLAIYRAHGGKIEKLRLWGTFHPQMAGVGQFLEQCRLLSGMQIAYCVGAVGVPEQIDQIRRLKKGLPEHIYLWINKMDGLGRAYTEEEIDAFMQLDEYFGLELAAHDADYRDCMDNRFVEADGTMRRCNISRRVLGNFYSVSGAGKETGQEAVSGAGKETGQRAVSGAREETEQGAVSRVGKETGQGAVSGSEKETEKESEGKGSRLCGRKRCSCYLAYCNRPDMRLLFFQPYPAFRIPVYPKAVFMDIDGTLLPEGETRIPGPTVQWLRALSTHCSLYAATSRPLESAMAILHPVWRVMRGGVFANGARCVVRGEGGIVMDEIRQMETGWVAAAEKAAARYGYKARVYQKSGRAYKIVFVERGATKNVANHTKSSVNKNVNKNVKKDIITDASDIKSIFHIPDTCLLIQEKNCIQVTAQGTGKLQGVLRVCKQMGYLPQDVAVIGNSANDMPMLSYFAHSAKV